MRWFGSILRPATPVLDGDGLILRHPRLEDYTAWTELRAASRTFLSPFEPVWPEDDLERPAFRRRVERHDLEAEQGLAHAFYIFRGSDDALLGGVNLSHIRRGVMQAASLGYWMGAPHAGQGIMTRAVGVLMPFAFRTLKLHRIEAACLPHNAPSIHLLEKVGFTREGYARKYLNIAGSWQDHLLFALLGEDWAKTH